MRVQFAAEALYLWATIAHVRRGRAEEARQRIRRLARLSRRVLTREWQWARKNLQLTFGPSLSANEVDRLATIAFEEHFVSYLEAIRPRDGMTVRIDGMDRFLKARAEGRGTILCAVHLGCWEAAVAHLADLGLPVSAVYRPARNPLERSRNHECAPFPRRFVGRRREAARGGAPGRGGQGPCGDDRPRRKQGGINANFLGLEASCPTGPARLAARYGVPVVAGVAVREGPGRAMLWCTDPLDPPASGDAAGIPRVHPAPQRRIRTMGDRVRRAVQLAAPALAHASQWNAMVDAHTA